MSRPKGDNIHDMLFTMYIFSLAALALP